MKTNRLYKLLSDIKRHPQEFLNLFLESGAEESFLEIGEELKSIVCSSDFTNVLTDTGVVTENSLLREFLYRTNRKFIPPVYKRGEFRGLLRTLNEHFNFTETILVISSQTLAVFLKKCLPEQELAKISQSKKLHIPFKILITRLIYHSTSRQIFSRLESAPELQSSILDLDQIAFCFLQKATSENFANLQKALSQCEEACEHIRDNRTTEGISLDVTFRLMAIQDILARIRGLCHLMSPSEKSDPYLSVAVLVQTILYLEQESNKIGSLFWSYVELVSYEITEHTGRKGDDYIQRDKQGTLKMLKKGVVGGALVGLFAFLKPLMHEWELPPFLEAVGFSFIYSGIFLLIHFFGGVLATKQPAMTASRIAHELDEAKPSTKYLWEISSLIRDTFRSQFLAIFGNFILALPVAGLVYWGLSVSEIFRFQTGTAQYLIKSLHPILSFSLFYAALTGLCLALSGIVAGALRNWFIFNKISDRVNNNSFIISVVTRVRIRKATDIFDRHLEALAGNVSLGFLLGFLSTAGSVFGLPIDIRHITFAAAQLGTALVHFEFGYNSFYVASVVLGVLLIGIINLSVSFTIIFMIAAKSRKLSFEQGRRLVAICVSRFFKNPSQFFWRA